MKYRLSKGLNRICQSVLVFLAAILLPADAQANLASGLVAHWTFNEGAGAVAGDASGNNNPGLLTDGPVWTTGNFGGGLRFDGVDDFVDVADSSTLNPTAALTLAV